MVITAEQRPKKDDSALEMDLQNIVGSPGAGTPKLLCIPILFLIFVWGVTETQAVTGKPYVVDGDTVKISGETIRLQGIDAPEIKQQCINATGKSYSCGLVSTNALRVKIGNSSITCKGETRDRYGRLISICYLGEFDLTSIQSGCHIQKSFLGICYLNEFDLNGWMVKNGYALAYRRYSKMYIDVERMASKSSRGIWGGKFVWPWNWRKGERLHLN